MMKRNFLLSLLLLLGLMAWAEPITRQQAYDRARAFFASRGVALSSKGLSLSPMSGGDTAALYVVNAGAGRGYVVLAGDDAAPAILGYATSGALDTDSLPEGLDALLKSYTRQINLLRSGTASAPTATATVRAAITPMLTTRWNQSAPYNQACPDFFGQGRAVTGCVATAMAQLLYYQWQQHPTTMVTTTRRAIAAYECRRTWGSQGQVQVPAVPLGSPIDWQNMADRVTSTSSEAARQAVADLMLYCGASVGMDYANSANGGSGASSWSVAEALINVFGFDASTTHVSADNYSLRAWNDLIYAELQTGRVVFYSGQSQAGSGHAFLIDGYDRDDYFHVNWGWGGTANGYYLLSVLEPSAVGIGAGDMAGGFHYDMDAILGAEPQHGGTTQLSVYMNNFKVSGTLVSYTGYNWSDAGRDLHLGLALYDGEGRQLRMLNNVGGYVNPNQGWNIGYEMTNERLAAGRYRVVPMGRFGSAAPWQKLWSDDKYLQVDVTAGSSMTFTLMPQAMLTATAPTVSGVCTSGYPATVTTRLGNEGTADYVGTLFLWAARGNETPTRVARKNAARVPAGDTLTLRFDWLPLEAGTYTLFLTDDEAGTHRLGATGGVEIARGHAASSARYVLRSVVLQNMEATHPHIDADGRLVQSVDGDALSGACSLQSTQRVNDQMVVDLYRLGDSGSWERVRRSTYRYTCIGDSGTAFQARFDFTALAPGKYKLMVQAGTWDAATQTINPETWHCDSYAYQLGSTVGIAPATAAAGPRTVYTLDGRRLGTLTPEQIRTLPRGIYIINGKKLLVR